MSLRFDEDRKIVVDGSDKLVFTHAELVCKLANPISLADLAIISSAYKDELEDNPTEYSMWVVSSMGGAYGRYEPEMCIIRIDEGEAQRWREEKEKHEKEQREMLLKEMEQKACLTGDEAKEEMKIPAQDELDKILEETIWEAHGTSSKSEKTNKGNGEDTPSQFEAHKNLKPEEEINLSEPPF